MRSRPAVVREIGFPGPHNVAAPLKTSITEPQTAIPQNIVILRIAIPRNLTFSRNFPWYILDETRSGWMIPRHYGQLERFLEPGKVLVIHGPRQVGKTTLIREYLKKAHWRARVETGEDVRLQELFAIGRIDRLLEFVAGHELLVIDEAQVDRENYLDFVL
ncbi:MAG: hypothetical protein CVU65_18495 [Deltaproteobacteria bacterium HGW-Deltaproteobacteria-22]|jgi:hypothetical protein|nr:MAG: hypothetical protein CVU65_18495 [Deltaproteobacteria bacterium HGW-Deltaproteobacteria-22]